MTRGYGGGGRVMVRLAAIVLALTVLGAGTAQAYTTIGRAWPNPPVITFEISTVGLPKGTKITQVEAGAREAAELWRLAFPKLTFVYAGRTTRAPVNGDGHSVIAFGNTLPHLATARCIPNECDMTLGPVKYSWYSFYGDTRDMTRYHGPSIILHEMGHWLGLGHSDGDCSAMCATTFPGAFHIPLADDVAGLWALYP